MMNKKVLLVAALVLGLAQVATADIVSNGGFENTTFMTGDPPVNTPLYGGDYIKNTGYWYETTVFDGWTASVAGSGGFSGVVDTPYMAGDPPAAVPGMGAAPGGRATPMGVANGDHAFWMESNGAAASISQEITIATDGSYYLSLDAIGAPLGYGASAGSSTISATIGSTVVNFDGLASFTPTGNNGVDDAVWATHVSDGVALTAGTYTLTISGIAGGWSSSAIDNVSLVPEPSTLALLSAGLVGLLAYAWRKRK